MPRKCPRHILWRRGSAGFNEAGAVMPRKVGALGVRSAPAHCFNEAGAVMPRKPPWVGGGY